ncbi:MAG: prolyl-tRNA synthetase associated domain-containing protein [Bacteroidales bacterium]|nr:prolyl-tRNA synthetase associated domain-containing protein [Bacteroidales bacterium]
MSTINKLQSGHPENIEGRSERELRCYNWLDAHHINYESFDHDASFTMDVCAEFDTILNATTCKNLFLCNRQKTKFFLLMIPGEKKFLTKDISQQIGSARLSFASADDMLKYLDTEPGSVSLLGLMNDNTKTVQLLIDNDVLKCEYIGIHPCVNTTSLRLSVDELINKVVPALEHTPIMVTL